jgi:hypothetical protein
MTSRYRGCGNAENMSTFLNSVIDNVVLLTLLVLHIQAKLRKLIGNLNVTLRTYICSILHSFLYETI